MKLWAWQTLKEPMSLEFKDLVARMLSHCLKWTVLILKLDFHLQWISDLDGLNIIDDPYFCCFPWAASSGDKIASDIRIFYIVKICSLTTFRQSGVPKDFKSYFNIYSFSIHSFHRCIYRM
jgi:hypothetical protein